MNKNLTPMIFDGKNNRNIAEDDERDRIYFIKKMKVYEELEKKYPEKDYVKAIARFNEFCEWYDKKHKK
jgi:hypothetical protein